VSYLSPLGAFLLHYRERKGKLQSFPPFILSFVVKLGMVELYREVMLEIMRGLEVEKKDVTACLK
jgi:hypothetical protein